MIFRTYHENAMYVIQAPEGSKVVAAGDGLGELLMVEVMPGGMAVERRLPPSVLVKAALRGYQGLTVLEKRSPTAHPEVASASRMS